MLRRLSRPAAENRMTSRRMAVLGAISAAILVAPGAAVAHPSQPAQPLPPSSDFQKVTLNDFPGEPIARVRSA